MQDTTLPKTEGSFLPVLSATTICFPAFDIAFCSNTAPFHPQTCCQSQHVHISVTSLSHIVFHFFFFFFITRQEPFRYSWQKQAHQGYLLSTMIHSFPLLSAFLLEANITYTPSRISCSHYNLCPLYLCDQVTLAYSTWHHT